MWDEEYLVTRIGMLRDMGLKNVYFKMAGFDPVDIERVLRIAASAEVDVVTFDGAGGGSGYSPCKMMNEWGLPTVPLESTVCGIARRLGRKAWNCPPMVITGGFATETRVFEALALGASCFQAVGLAGPPASQQRQKGMNWSEAGNIPAHLQKYGDSKETLFADLPDLRHLYGKEAESFPGRGHRRVLLSQPHRHGSAAPLRGPGNRKFDVNLLGPDDLIPLTRGRGTAGRKIGGSPIAGPRPRSSLHGRGEGGAEMQNPLGLERTGGAFPRTVPPGVKLLDCAPSPPLCA